jgi:hypothetical protein
MNKSNVICDLSVKALEDVRAPDDERRALGPGLPASAVPMGFTAAGGALDR